MFKITNEKTSKAPAKTVVKEATSQPSVDYGSRNLIILGVGAILISAITTCASLFMYWQSGDIYLDRSRPGYLPDPEEAKEEPEPVSFEFPDTGPVDQAELDRYLNELKTVNQHLTNISDPYESAPLSDESLGIPKATE